MSKEVIVIQPSQWLGGGEIGAFPGEQWDLRLLAQGDSWFSIGAFPPWKTTSVLAEIDSAGLTNKSAVIVNCAAPGKQLSDMSRWSRSPEFLQLFCGNLESSWDGLLLSGFGNDVIRAVISTPAAPLHQRLLKTTAEAGGAGAPAGAYISESGWQTLETFMRASFMNIMNLRVASSKNKNTPVFWHNYCRIMPRNSPAAAGAGPWFHKAFEAYGIADNAVRLAVVDTFQARSASLLNELVVASNAQYPNAPVHLVDSMSVGIAIANHGATGRSNDSENEIHLTRGGYKKVAVSWVRMLDAKL